MQNAALCYPRIRIFKRKGTFFSQVSIQVVTSSSTHKHTRSCSEKTLQLYKSELEWKYFVFIRLSPVFLCCLCEKNLFNLVLLGAKQKLLTPSLGIWKRSSMSLASAPKGLLNNFPNKDKFLIPPSEEILMLASKRRQFFLYYCDQQSYCIYGILSFINIII